MRILNCSRIIAKAFPSTRLLLLALIKVLAWQNASATLFFAEPFNYAEGANLGSTTGGGGATWLLSGGDVSQIKVTTASAQTSPKGYAAAAGRGVAVIPTGTRKQTGVPFHGATGVLAADGNIVYASFLLNVQALPAAGNMRVATTWQEVTSAGGSVAPPPVPVITQTLLGPQGLILRGTNGPPSSTYQVLASTEVALPASNWPSIAAHAFDGSGKFDSTNPVAPELTQQFFRLLVGGTIPPAPSAPVITNQPQSLNVAVSNNATFTVTAGGPAPLTYQWFFNTNTPVGGNSNVFTRLNAQTNHAGTYYVVITNNYGAVTSAFATLIISGAVSNLARFNLVGFAEGTTGGSVIPETDPAYRKVATPLEFAQAIGAANKGQGVKVIEIMNDLDLGWNEIGDEAKTTANSPFVSAIAPLLHPKLLKTGVSTVYINPKNGGLTIFSANGASIRHCCWGVKATSNIIIRNLKFDELWEWDEQGKGHYDKNNWDCVYPLRNNQTDPTNAIYTGKILAQDSIYHFDNEDGSTIDYRGDSTNATGYPYFGPKQATIKPFCWNTNAATPNGQLPYTYTMDDPSEVPAIVSSPTYGAGAGLLTWAKTNWLKTTY